MIAVSVDGSKIKAAIDAELLRRAEMSGITATYVLEGIRAIADDVNAKHTDRLRAYELLGKHLNLWKDKVEVDVTFDLAERIAEGRKRINAAIESDAAMHGLPPSQK